MALKWRLCLLLLGATTLNYLDRQTMSIVAPILQKDLHLTNESLGWLFAVFYYSYTFSQMAVGPLLDRSHLRWIYGSAVLAWSCVAAMTGLATGFAALILFRLLLGMAEAANWPGATRIVAGVFEPRERALGNGIFTSGTSVGALIAPAVILTITSTFGWRWAFILTGLLGTVWFVLWALSTRSPKLEPVWQTPRSESEPRTESLSQVLKQIVSSPRFFPVLVVAVLINPCLYFSVNWLPTYFAQQRGLLPGAQLGWILTAIYLGLGLGNLLCGTGVLAFTRRGYSLPKARQAVFLLATLPLIACAAVPFVRLGEAILILVFVNVGLGVWTAMYLTMVQDVCVTHISSSLGLLSGCGSLTGALAMWAVGKVTHQTGSFVIPMVVFSIAAVLSAIAGCVRNSERALAKVELKDGIA
jgi:MFS transporter, ACS family, aldohexuronate transporter